MTRTTATWLFLWLGCSLWAQFDNSDYPEWFLEPTADGHAVGIARYYSDESVTFENAYLDALAINELLRNGSIDANIIATRARLADSLGMNLSSSIELPKGVKLISSHRIGDLYCGLFSLTFEDGDVEEPVKSESGQNRITAVGKQTIHPDRIYESWASAEIQAFKELSRTKSSNIKSITKREMNRLEKLIYLQSSSRFLSARIERRWIKNNVAHVEVSDIY